MPNAARNVLIVDDEAATRQVLALVLQQMGHSVRCASNGLCALELMRERMPDVLLSDLQMPEKSGFELLSVVRRRLPDIYVIAMSGAFVGDDVPTGIAADAFYQKATSLESLLKLMEVGLNPARKHSYRSTAQTPMWVPKNRVRGSGESYVLIGCPECLRSFRKSVQEATGLVHEARCIYCSTIIHYAIVHSNGPFPAQGAVGQPALRTLTARRPQLATGS